MLRFGSMVATAALLLSASVSGVANRLPAASLPQDRAPAANQGQAAPSSAANQKPAPSKPATLTEESRLALIRYVDGEFARALVSIPTGKNGLHVKAGAQPKDDSNSNGQQLVVSSAAGAVNPGDTAQITALEFKERQIIVDLNGGGRKTRLRDRIHLDVSGVPTTQVTDVNQTAETPKIGGNIVLDFDNPVPDMTPEDLKNYLSGVLDFSTRHSAAVQWVDTLPPDIQNAIRDKRPIEGMDHDMVLAAMGRPDRKVRERENDGTETEDWIYGTPPAKTVFVKFEGDKVVQVRQYPE